MALRLGRRARPAGAQRRLGHQAAGRGRGPRSRSWRDRAADRSDGSGRSVYHGRRASSAPHRSTDPADRVPPCRDRRRAVGRDRSWSGHSDYPGRALQERSTARVTAIATGRGAAAEPSRHRLARVWCKRIYFLGQVPCGVRRVTKAYRVGIPHDLRRSVATHLAEIGVAPHIVEAVMGHAGHRTGVGGL